MKRTIINFITLILLTILIGCKNYYNDMIEWTARIEIGSDIKTVKDSQPNFLKIAWDKPLEIESETLYEITEIDGNIDFLKMQNFLKFENGKYQGCESMK